MPILIKSTSTHSRSLCETNQGLQTIHFHKDDRHELHPLCGGQRTGGEVFVTSRPHHLSALRAGLSFVCFFAGGGLEYSLWNKVNTFFPPPLMRSQRFRELERRRDSLSSLQEPDSDLGSLFLLEPRFPLLSSLAQQLSWMKRQIMLATNRLRGTHGGQH